MTSMVHSARAPAKCVVIAQRTLPYVCCVENCCVLATHAAELSHQIANLMLHGLCLFVQAKASAHAMQHGVVVGLVCF